MMQTLLVFLFTLINATANASDWQLGTNEPCRSDAELIAQGCGANGLVLTKVFGPKQYGAWVDTDITYWYEFKRTSRERGGRNCRIIMTYKRNYCDPSSPFFWSGHNDWDKVPKYGCRENWAVSCK